MSAHTTTSSIIQTDPNPIVRSHPIQQQYHLQPQQSSSSPVNNRECQEDPKVEKGVKDKSSSDDEIVKRRSIIVPHHQQTSRAIIVKGVPSNLQQEKPTVSIPVSRSDIPEYIEIPVLIQAEKPAPLPIKVVTRPEEVEVILPSPYKGRHSHQNQQASSTSSVLVDPVCITPKSKSQTNHYTKSRRGLSNNTCSSTCNNSKVPSTRTATTTKTSSGPIEKGSLNPLEANLPGLQYSRSFNSKSSYRSRNSFSFCDKDYSEEFRLLNLSSSSDFNYNHNTSATKGNKSKSKRHHHHRSHTVPLTSSSVTSSSSNMNINMKKTHSVSAHSNLGDLLIASKEMRLSHKHLQTQQEEAALAQGVPSTIQHGGGHQTGASPNGISPSSNMNHFIQTHHQPTNSAGSASGPSPDPTPRNAGTPTGNSGSGQKLPRPSSIDLSSRSKSTGMIPSYQNITSGPMAAPSHQQQQSLPQSQPEQFRHTMETAPSTRSMNPFEDPKLIGDLHNLQTNQNQNISNNTHNVAADPFAQFDPLNTSLPSSQLQPSKKEPPKPEPSPTIDTAQLSELAAALASLKPQQPNMNDNGNIITTQLPVGMSSSNSNNNKSHRRFLSLRGPKSMNNDEMNNVMENVPRQGTLGNFDSKLEGESHKKDKKDRRQNHRKSASMGFFKRHEQDGVDFNRPTTPTQNFNNFNEQEEDGKKSPGRRKRISIRLGKSHSRNNSYANSSNGSSSGSPNKGEIKIRSSEQDPSPHQISLPRASDVLIPARLCHLMERYREIDQNFDFNILTNVSRQDMELFVENRPKSPPIQVGSNGGNGTLTTPMIDPPMIKSLSPLSPPPVSSLHNLVPAHKPIVETIVSSANDLVLSAFYYEVDRIEETSSLGQINTTKKSCSEDRTEVAIFASDVLRQFIVVYQGGVKNQRKPIRNRFNKYKSKSSKNFGDEKNLSVFLPFEQGYNESGIEEKVFQKLDELAEQHPFFDVIVTGHSYGAALALLGGMRYACSRHAMMVTCYAFGCPKVGALDFRHFVNSLPNLKVMRLEYGHNKWVHAPDHPIWTHAGHTISIMPQQLSSKEKKISANDKSIKDHHNMIQSDFLIRAYKFGNSRPDSSSGKFIGKKGNNQDKQIDHGISSYLNVIEMITKGDYYWPRQFAGEEGTGVRGLNKEKRLVC